jgi:3-isopropylmalate/(R)-2-methylmalate dehydratase small subunit
MDAFTTHTGTAAPLRRSNVDTDQIIPAEYLKRITRTGFEDGLFVAWRTNEPDFVLNQPEYADASILVAGPDFGTGSSREHAVWALLDGGFRVVISSRFADIFRNNSTKAGLLTVLLPQGDVEALWTAVEAEPTTPVTVDLQAKQVTYGQVTVPFEIDDYTRWRLLEGLDDVGLTERHLDDITAFEAQRPGWLPRSLPALPASGRAGDRPLSPA